MTSINAIERLRRAGVPRSAITKACNVSRAAVSHWARGRSVPKGDNFNALVELASRHGVILLASDFAATVPVPCQANKGDGGFLIQTATSAPNHPRGLAFDHADCVAADEQQHNDI